MKLLSYILGSIVLTMIIICLCEKATVLAIVQQISTIINELIQGQVDAGAFKTLAGLVVQAISNFFQNILAAIEWLISELPG